ncbi:MAG: hypothetical protein JSU65_13270 [Candidatus Zixiibacteriota bacterium]|nr:MAG: hypothetical protein JSU65_13270 [candidate division Zixibacteria bacterium]
MRHFVIQTVMVLAAVSGAAGQTSARTSVTLTGDQIPARLHTSSPLIFSGSDTLTLNGLILERGVSYRFVSGQGYFDLSSLTLKGSDTLEVTYHPVPLWATRIFGRSAPNTDPVRSMTRSEARLPGGTSQHSIFTSSMRISGAKTFRFLAGPTGTSGFGQSLDLSVEGELAENVRLSGSISDRGYNPAYGTSNSRLSEMDRVNLKVTSPHFAAQVGDISTGGSMLQPRTKDVSGAAFRLRYPKWHMEGTAARPRGRYETARLTGQDGYQGPYRVSPGGGSMPVVPGSETVWLDGQELERGAGKDYTVDYPAGQVTFNVNHPIDSRSRIEVDFEALTTDYKEELLSFSGGGELGDSLLYFSAGVLREGDDRGRMLVGELSETDKDLLRAAGDEDAFKSGVILDTTGAYVLDTIVLPDSVYLYVGEGYGTLDLSFSFVGAGKGDYRFLGNDVFEYVGPKGGDYLPIVIIPAAERVSHYAAQIGSSSPALGDLRLDLRASEHDRNLWSHLDDDDNHGVYYDLTARKPWTWSSHESHVAVRRRVRQIEFQPLQRISRADFSREFYAPEQFVPAADEQLHEVRTQLGLNEDFQLSGFFEHLDYPEQFESRRGGTGFTYAPAEYLQISGGWHRLTANLAGGSLSGEGDLTTYDAAVLCKPGNRVEISTAFQRDARDNTYSGESRGTRYDRIRTFLKRGNHRVDYEYYGEDSLAGNWQQSLTRNRVSATSSSRLARFDYTATASYQWSARPGVRENSFLGRLTGRYHDVRRSLEVSSAYSISRERRNARGIVYLAVDPGQGDYVFENGRYVPDQDGDFIRVDEILSDQARVRRGEKSFRLNKNWPSVLLRFDSNIEEELTGDDRRSILWILPFYSDESQTYLFYSRRYNLDLRLVPLRSFHIINLRLTQNLEKRDVASATRRRRDTEGALAVKQAVASTYLVEAIKWFGSERDIYFASAGEVTGYEPSLSLTQAIGSSEMTCGVRYRRAETSANAVCHQYAVSLGSRISLVKGGLIHVTAEFYRQKLSEPLADGAYLLTDGRSGERGAVWSASFNYGVKGRTRINATFSGRHADDRVARITARTEVITEF